MSIKQLIWTKMRLIKLKLRTGKVALMRSLRHHHSEVVSKWEALQKNRLSVPSKWMISLLSKEGLEDSKWLNLLKNSQSKEALEALRWLKQSLNLLSKEALVHLKWLKLLSLLKEEHLELLRWLKHLRLMMITKKFLSQKIREPSNHFKWLQTQSHLNPRSVGSKWVTNSVLIKAWTVSVWVKVNSHYPSRWFKPPQPKQATQLCCSTSVTVT